MTLLEPPSPQMRSKDIARPEFWREHFPTLTINSRLEAWNRPSEPLGDEQRNLYFARMLEEGYFQEQDETCARLAPALADAIKTCKQLDIPPAFIFLFDEAWECFYAQDPMIRFFLGDGYKVLPDFWAWHVDPAAAESGWRPHRDKGRAALAPNRAPTSLTMWIPLTDSLPQNGCMYVLPANLDPTYGTENEKSWQIDVTAVRALPGKPGDYFCWNQAVLHWGARTSRFAKAPRLSMALEFQRGDINAWNMPLMDPFTNHPFEARLKLVGKQILQYKHMYPLAERFQKLAEELVAP
jgi:ectoine hydroxylase-related dioxygenase (phytanoyl-CoA dioxygenase family)